MLHSVVDTILTYIDGLSFIDKIGGVVYPLQKKQKAQEGFVIKTIPVYGNNPTVCGNDAYIDLIPDDRFKSVVYFEATPEVVEQIMGSKVVTSSTLTLVGWFNLPKINKAFTSDNAKFNCEAMLRNMANLINGKHDITGTIADIEVTRFNYRDPATFSRYTYDEAEKQYLIYPFDFGTVEFSVQLIYDMCDNEPDIDPDCKNS